MIYIACVISREEGRSKERRAGGMLYSTLRASADICPEEDGNYGAWCEKVQREAKVHNELLSVSLIH